MANPLEAVGVKTTIPAKYTFQIPSRKFRNDEKRFAIAVHVNWVRELVNRKQIPEVFEKHESLPDDEIQALLSQGRCRDLGSNWIFLNLTVLRVPKRIERFRTIEGTTYLPKNRKDRLLSSQVVDFIGESNFNYLWEQPQISFLGNTEKVEKEETEETFATDLVRKLLKCIYGMLDESSLKDSLPETTPAPKPDDKSKSENSSKDDNRFFISSLCQALTIFDIPFSDTEQNFLIFQPYIPFSLYDAITFSPQKLNSTSRQLFVIYQILNFLKDFEFLKIPLGNITLHDFRIDECLYIDVFPSISDILERLKFQDQERVFEGIPEITRNVKLIAKKARGWYSVADGDSPIRLDPETIELTIRHWCEGLVSNYDYLLFINFLAGRICDGNPNFHPVFPWVTDFKSPHGNIRELTKSKYRLNKGDNQLDIMYQDSTTNSDNMIAHHITDILSEITYYVYKARRTPKEVLCKFVRSKWVPGEYPVSITRMQEWTPDECIPEFFDDPEIFESIHEDLPDLNVPKWCSSAEEFINSHRKVLESEIVSAKLHHWIDLMFGYKLSGTAAVKSKNIYLSMVDSHQHLESHGIVQLFQSAHPPRRNSVRDVRNAVSYDDIKKLKGPELNHSKDSAGSNAASTSNSSSSSNSSEARTKILKSINLNLPKHYDPMGFLNDFEVSVNFFKTHFPYLRDAKVLLRRRKNEHQVSDAVKIFGCLLLEIVLPQKIRHCDATLSIDDKFEFYKRVVSNSMTLVPSFCRRAVQTIFDRDSLEFAIPLEISLDLLLLGDKLGPILFPGYFKNIYKTLRIIRSYENAIATAPSEDQTYRSNIQDLKVQSFSRHFLQLLTTLDKDGIDLLLPFVIEMFEKPETRVKAVWNFFCPCARAIGKKRALENFMYLIIQIFDSGESCEKHGKLFHRKFLLQLISCFGTKKFLENFPTILIETLGGWKLSGKFAHGPRTRLDSTELKIESTPSCSHAIPRTTFVRLESESSESQPPQNVEPELFLMEPEISDSDEGKEEGKMDIRSILCDETPLENQNLLTFKINKDDSPAKNSYLPHLPSRAPSGTIASSASTRCSASDISELCFESLIWLAHRIGPVLTAKYLTTNLLRMLTLCYLGHLNPSESENEWDCDGDMYVVKPINCLLTISDLFGDAFVERQYIRYAVKSIGTASPKLSTTMESAVMGVGSLLERSFQYVSDTTLMSILQGVVVDGIFNPLMCLVCSPETVFPSGTFPRGLLAQKIVRMLNLVRKKIGPDLSQLHLTPLVIQICSTFQAIYIDHNPAYENMDVAFDSYLAHQIFSNFGDVISGTDFEDLIRDLYLREGLSNETESLKFNESISSAKMSQKSLIDQQSSFASRSFGNRIEVEEADNPVEENEVDPGTRKDTTRHLKGNWLLYWEHELGRMDVKFNFKQIKLHTFVGHTAAVRCIYALDNENSFITASKDKTVKLFSLRNQGDESVVSNCNWTYYRHKKPVLSVLFLDTINMAASTDGSVHVWDPFVGVPVRVLDKSGPKTSPICAIRSVSNSSFLIGAGIDSTINVIDVRSCCYFELKIGVGGTNGLVRCVAVGENGHTVVVGHSSGMLSALDLRNGTLLGSWKGHDGEVLQLVPHRNNQFVSSSFDQNISVWNLDDNKLMFHMKGPTEPVHSLSIYESELISCTTSNRIGVHSGIEPNSDFTSSRLRSDTFKGVVTSVRLCPLNQFMLLGSETGNVVLLA